MYFDFDALKFKGMETDDEETDDEETDDEEFIDPTLAILPISAPSVQTTLDDAPISAPSVQTLGKVKTALPFDDVLRKLINEAPGIEWNIEGTGFYIHDRDKLTHFLRDTRDTLFTSLQKQLNSYQFHNRKTKTGDSLFYHHPDFNRSKNVSAPLRKRTKGLVPPTFKTAPLRKRRLAY